MVLLLRYGPVFISSQAAMAVFEDKHQDAPDLPTDDEDDGRPATIHAAAPGTDLKGKGRQMTKAPVSLHCLLVRPS